MEKNVKFLRISRHIITSTQDFFNREWLNILTEAQRHKGHGAVVRYFNFESNQYELLFYKARKKSADYRDFTNRTPEFLLSFIYKNTAGKTARNFIYMKNHIKLKTVLRITGIIAFVAVIGFTMTGCPGDPETSPFEGTWTNSYTDV